MKMSKTVGRELAFKAWQLISLLLCITLFMALMVDIGYKYTSEMTTVGIQYSGINTKEKSVPCLTFCPWMGFKEKGFHFKRSEFNRTTFTKEEVFANLTSWNSTIEFTIEEVGGVFMGQCFMVCPLKNMTMGSHRRIYIKNTLDLKGMAVKNSCNNLTQR